MWDRNSPLDKQSRLLDATMGAAVTACAALVCYFRYGRLSSGVRRHAGHRGHRVTMTTRVVAARSQAGEIALDLATYGSRRDRQQDHCHETRQCRPYADTQVSTLHGIGCSVMEKGLIAPTLGCDLGRRLSVNAYWADFQVHDFCRSAKLYNRLPTICSPCRPRRKHPGMSSSLAQQT